MDRRHTVLLITDACSNCQPNRFARFTSHEPQFPLGFSRCQLVDQRSAASAPCSLFLISVEGRERRKDMWLMCASIFNDAIFHQKRFFSFRACLCVRYSRVQTIPVDRTFLRRMQFSLRGSVPQFSNMISRYLFYIGTIYLFYLQNVSRGFGLLTY